MELLSRIEKPLRFAAGRSFENLRALRDLEKTLLRAVEQSKEDPHAARITELVPADGTERKSRGFLLRRR